MSWLGSWLGQFVGKWLGFGDETPVLPVDYICLISVPVGPSAFIIRGPTLGLSFDDFDSLGVAFNAPSVPRCTISAVVSSGAISISRAPSAVCAMGA